MIQAIQAEDKLSIQWYRKVIDIIIDLPAAMKTTKQQQTTTSPMLLFSEHKHKNGKDSKHCHEGTIINEIMEMEVSEYLDIVAVCRICLAQQGNVNIFGKGKDMVKELHGYSVAECIMSFACVEVSLVLIEIVDSEDGNSNFCSAFRFILMTVSLIKFV